MQDADDDDDDDDDDDVRKTSKSLYGKERYKSAEGRGTQLSKRHTEHTKT